MLTENMRSIGAQFVHPAAHLVLFDYAHHGCVSTLNRLWQAAADMRYIAVLADDDLADPHHLESLLEHAEDAEIVYSWCRVEGRPWSPNRPRFDADLLREFNYIPATALIRTTLLRELGGWREHRGGEDWNFWLRALDAGARFKLVPEVTWTYRFHGGNASWRPT